MFLVFVTIFCSISSQNFVFASDESVEHFPENSSLQLNKLPNSILISCNGTSVSWIWTNSSNMQKTISIGDENFDLAFDKTIGNSSLTIKHFDYSLAGTYKCVVDNKKNFEFQITTFPLPSKSMKYTKFDKDKNLFTMRSENAIEGNDITLECSIDSFPLTNELTWSTEENNKKIQNETKFSIINEKFGFYGFKSKLTISNLETSDRKNYICKATNSKGTMEYSTLVRVKDKLAPLWPAIGILAEFLIVAVIIILCERHRKKVEEREEMKSQ